MINILNNCNIDSEYLSVSKYLYENYSKDIVLSYLVEYKNKNNNKTNNKEIESYNTNIKKIKKLLQFLYFFNSNLKINNYKRLFNYVKLDKHNLFCQQVKIIVLKALLLKEFYDNNCNKEIKSKCLFQKINNYENNKHCFMNVKKLNRKSFNCLMSKINFLINEEKQSSNNINCSLFLKLLFNKHTNNFNNNLDIDFYFKTNIKFISFNDFINNSLFNKKIFDFIYNCLIKDFMNNSINYSNINCESNINNVYSIIQNNALNFDYKINKYSFNKYTDVKLNSIRCNNTLTNNINYFCINNKRTELLILYDNFCEIYNLIDSNIIYQYKKNCISCIVEDKRFKDTYQVIDNMDKSIKRSKNSNNINNNDNKALNKSNIFNNSKSNNSTSTVKPRRSIRILKKNLKYNNHDKNNNTKIHFNKKDINYQQLLKNIGIKKNTVYVNYNNIKHQSNLFDKPMTYAKWSYNDEYALICCKEKGIIMYFRYLNNNIIEDSIKYINIHDDASIISCASFSNNNKFIYIFTSNKYLYIYDNTKLIAKIHSCLVNDIQFINQINILSLPTLNSLIYIDLEKLILDNIHKDSLVTISNYLTNLNNNSKITVCDTIISYCVNTNCILAINYSLKSNVIVLYNICNSSNSNSNNNYNHTFLIKLYGHKQSNLNYNITFGGYNQEYIITGSEDAYIYVWNIKCSLPICKIKTTELINLVYWPICNYIFSLSELEINFYIYDNNYNIEVLDHNICNKVNKYHRKYNTNNCKKSLNSIDLIKTNNILNKKRRNFCYKNSLSTSNLYNNTISSIKQNSISEFESSSSSSSSCISFIISNNLNQLEEINEEIIPPPIRRENMLISAYNRTHSLRSDNERNINYGFFTSDRYAGVNITNRMNIDINFNTDLNNQDLSIINNNSSSDD